LSSAQNGEFNSKQTLWWNQS